MSNILKVIRAPSRKIPLLTVMVQFVYILYNLSLDICIDISLAVKYFQIHQMSMLIN